MTKDMLPTVVRRFLRVLALAPAVAVVTVATPALAEPPENWEPPSNGSTIHAILLLAGTPVLLFVVIALLVYLPSLVGGQKYDTTLAWRDQPEWFGGPRQGVDAAPEEPSEGKERGGAGANW